MKTELTAESISEALSRYTGAITVLDGFTEIKPWPERRAEVDERTKLNRKNPRIKVDGLVVDEKLEIQRARRARGRKLLAEEWPELNSSALSKQYGLHKTTIEYRLGAGQTLQQALTK